MSYEDMKLIRSECTRSNYEDLGLSDLWTSSVNLIQVSFFQSR